MNRKLLFARLISSIGVAAAFGFAGCQKTPATPVNPGPGPIIPEPPVVTTMTFDDLIDDHSVEATQFFKQYLKDTLTGGNETKAESWYLNDKDGDNKVDSATMQFTYSVDETLRAVQVATVDFSPIDCKDIAESSVTSVNITNYDSREIFKFDAKENYNNQDVANALYSAIEKNNDVNLFREIEKFNGDRQFVVFNTYTDSIATMQVAVPEGDGSKQVLLNNLSRSNFMTTDETVFTLDGACLSSRVYELENLGGSEIVDPGKDPEKDPDKNQITDAKAVELLEANCMDEIINIDNPILKLDKKNVLTSEWYFSKDTDGKIIGAENMFMYKLSETSAYYKIVKLQFKEGLTVENINADIIKNGLRAYSSSSFNQSTSAQIEYKDLTNAICNKLFGEADENTQRFIVQTSASTEFGGSIGFKVIEKRENSIKESEIQIATSPEDYETNFNNDLYTKVLSGNKHYEISGERITTEKTPEAEATAYCYAIDFGDDDIRLL